jgi:hydroxymethylpyrimidine pyrophosphatase-like HAD family hydrolase
MNISPSISRSPALTKVLFLSDLDGTWLGDERQMLNDNIGVVKDEYRARGIDLEFGYVTARPPERVAQEGLPTPDWTVTFNGGTIHKGAALAEDGSRNKPFQAWEDLNEETGFHSDDVQAAFQQIATTDPEFAGLRSRTVGEVVNNPAADKCDFASHLVFDESTVRLTEAEKADDNNNGIPDLFEPETFSPPEQIQNLTKKLSDSLTQNGVEHEISPIYAFKGKPLVMFDAASRHANKGDAVQFLRDAQGVAADHLIVAGDGGNDAAMIRPGEGLDDGRRSIIVGPEETLREAAAPLRNAIIQPVDTDSAKGVYLGLRQHLDAIVRELEASRRN